MGGIVGGGSPQVIYQQPAEPEKDKSVDQDKGLRRRRSGGAINSLLQQINDSKKTLLGS